MKYSHIVATGSYLPSRIVTNDDLAKIFSTSDEWIKEKTGICERRFAALGEGVSDMAFEATKKALSQANLTSKDLDGIIFATSTPEYQAPGSAFLLQNKLECGEIFGWDIRNTSPGFLAALELADGLIARGRYKRLLVVASEVHSTALDFSDRGRLMSVIFGDGCGCFILEQNDTQKGILDVNLFGMGSGYDKLWCQLPSSLIEGRINSEQIEQGLHHPQMDGRAVFENAVDKMSDAIIKLLVKNKMNVADLDWFVPHQANLRIIESIGQRINVDFSKMIVNIERVANTSSASIPLAFDEAVRAGHIQRGDKILVSTFGSGFSWGAGLIEY